MFQDLSLPANVGVFLAAAVLVWIAGWRVARYADAIQARTGIGEAWLGLLLLGGISGLPELAVTATSALQGHPVLAVNNIAGSAATNLAILGAADAAVKRETLTVSIATPTPLLQAALVIVMLTVIGAGALTAGEAQWLGIGAWSWAALALYLLFLYWVRNTQGTGAWRPRERGAPPRTAHGRPRGDAGRLWGKTALGAAVILVAGYALALSGAAIAGQSGLGETFFGAVFLSFATSLSDISIVFSAVRAGRFDMAVSDVFGSALFTLALVFVIDAAYDGAPVLARVGHSTTFMTLAASAMAALYIAGAIERRSVRIGRMGVDSLALIGAYLAAVYLLYRMR